jgi:hypothetical protein
MVARSSWYFLIEYEYDVAFLLINERQVSRP